MVRCVVTVYMHRYVGSMYFIQSLWDVTYSRSTLLALFVCNTGIVLQVLEARGIHFNKGGKLDLFFFVNKRCAHGALFWEDLVAFKKAGGVKCFGWCCH